MHKKDMIENAEIGDSIYFGDYEQDGDTENGKEMIEWIVLDEQEGSILVISKFALDAMAFNSDEAAYGGFSRLSRDERHATVDGWLSLYLPSRVALVLKKIK